VADAERNAPQLRVFREVFAKFGRVTASRAPEVRVFGEIFAKSRQMRSATRLNFALYPHCV
jgi:hypothetical protein